MNVATFKKVCLPYNGIFYRVAYRLLENSQDAEDIVQDVYEKLWKSRESLGQIKNIEAYGVTLTKNLCLDRLKSARHKSINCESEETLTEEMTENLDLNEVNSEISLIKEISKKLPENQQLIFNLRYFKDLSPQEIEKMTGIQVGNIRVLLSRARKSVQEYYSSCCKAKTGK